MTDYVWTPMRYDVSINAASNTTAEVSSWQLAVSASLCIQTATSDLSQYRALLFIYLTTYLYWILLRGPPFNLEQSLLRVESVSYIYVPV